MMNPEEIEQAIESLVATRYPYEVAAILDQIDHPTTLATVVAAALARSVKKGHEQGVDDEKERLRGVLGL